VVLAIIVIMFCFAYLYEEDYFEIINTYNNDYIYHKW